MALHSDHFKEHFLHILLSYLSVKARVLYGRLAKDDDELTIKEGEIIENVTENDGGWWEGEINGKRGLFPDNYVELIEDGEAWKKVNTDCVKGGKYFSRIF